MFAQQVQSGIGCDDIDAGYRNQHNRPIKEAEDGKPREKHVIAASSLNERSQSTMLPCFGQRDRARVEPEKTKRKPAFRLHLCRADIAAHCACARDSHQSAIVDAISGHCTPEQSQSHRMITATSERKTVQQSAPHPMATVKPSPCAVPCRTDG